MGLGYWWWCDWARNLSGGAKRRRREDDDVAIRAVLAWGWLRGSFGDEICVLLIRKGKWRAEEDGALLANREKPEWLPR